MKRKKTNPHRGSSLDQFLEEEGIREEATFKAVKKVLAWPTELSVRDFLRALRTNVAECRWG